MEFDTQYAMKLFFPNPAFAQVYYEAVANALDADADWIRIEIRTEGSVKAPDVQISIRDNGVGFTEERYGRFKRVKEPKDAYHKGLGRLIYLRYFREVAVTSIFEGSKREFLFVHNFNGKSTTEAVDPTVPNRTELVFRHFRGDRLRSYDDLKPGILCKRLLEQFLPVLYERKRAGRPVTIDVELFTSESNPQKGFYPNREQLDETDLPEFKSSTIKDDTIDLFGEIKVHYFVKSGEPDPILMTAAVIDRRTVPLKLLSPGSVPPGTSVLFLFESELFNGNSDTARQRLVVPEGVQESALYRALKNEVGRILTAELPEIKVRNAETRQQFENHFPHLIGLFDAETVGLIEREEAIETAQRRFFQKQKQVLESDPSDESAFQKSLELSARSLMEYILYRDWIIDRLCRTSPKDREETIHDLLVPRYNRFDESNLIEGLYRNNAWVLDDKFMTFRTILSEATMSELIAAITLAEDRVDDGRPDISMIFSADPEKET